MTPHEEKMVREFTMARTDEGKGKGVVFTIRMSAYPDGKVFLQNDDNHDLREPYSPGYGPAELFPALCARAVREAGEI
jgi:hypothetical protein